MCPTSAKHGRRLFSTTYLVLVLCEGIPASQDCLPLRLVETVELYVSLLPIPNPAAQWWKSNGLFEPVWITEYLLDILLCGELLNSGWGRSLLVLLWWKIHLSYLLRRQWLAEGKSSWTLVFQKNPYKSRVIMASSKCLAVLKSQKLWVFCRLQTIKS